MGVRLFFRYGVLIIGVAVILLAVAFLLATVLDRRKEKKKAKESH